MWLCENVVWAVSTESVGHDFSIALTSAGAPVVGVLVELQRSQDTSVPIAADGPTNSNGVAYFSAVPRGSYWARVKGGLLFPGKDLNVSDDEVSGNQFSIEWPRETLRSQVLRGKLVTSLRSTDSGSPLRKTRVQLLDLHTGQLIEQTMTESDGSYSLSTILPGVYVLRITPPIRKDFTESSRDTAVEVDGSASEASLPTMKVLQSECDGVELLVLRPGHSGKNDEDWTR